jgi:hypothetical protein
LTTRTAKARPRVGQVPAMTVIAHEIIAAVSLHDPYVSGGAGFHVRTDCASGVEPLVPAVGHQSRGHRAQEDDITRFAREAVELSGMANEWDDEVHMGGGGGEGGDSREEPVTGDGAGSVAPPIVGTTPTPAEHSTRASAAKSAAQHMRMATEGASCRGIVKKKWWIVLSGHRTGLFDSWPETCAQVSGYPNNSYWGFVSRQQAVSWVNTRGFDVSPAGDLVPTGDAVTSGSGGMGAESRSVASGAVTMSVDTLLAHGVRASSSKSNKDGSTRLGGGISSPVRGITTGRAMSPECRGNTTLLPDRVATKQAITSVRQELRAVPLSGTTRLTSMGKHPILDVATPREEDGGAVGKGKEGRNKSGGVARQGTG